MRATSAEPQRRERATGRPREKLLLVAPDSLTRDRVVESLREQDYEIFAASSWVAALALAAVHSRSLDLLIVDRLLPGVGGLDLARRIRIVHPALPVVLTRVNGSCPGDRLLEEVAALLRPSSAGSARRAARSAPTPRPPAARADVPRRRAS